MNHIEKIWKELYEYWDKYEVSCKKCIGATEEELLKLESSIGFKVPEVLKESLRYCNSYPTDFNQIKSCGLFLGNGSTMFDIDTIIEIYLDGIEYGYVEDKFYIPIYDWNGDIFIFLSSKNGKIIYSDMECNIKKVIFNTYVDFLEYIKKSIIEKGNFSYDDLKKL